MSDPNLINYAGAAVVGAIVYIGGKIVFSFIANGKTSDVGLKAKINGIEKRVDRMSENVVYSDTCGERVLRLEEKIDNAIEILKEVRDQQ